MQLIYLMFFIALALFGCKQNSTEPFGIEHTTLPESAEVQVPSIIMSVGIESGGMSLSWSVCDGARVYELEELNSGTWQLIFSGNATGYGLGNLSPGIERSFRVRAVYERVVSRWSQPVTAP